MKQPSQRSKPLSLLIILGLLQATACTKASSNACGTLYAYSPEFEEQAAIELDYLQGTGQSPHVVTMIQDYGTTRQTIRACK